MEKGDLVHIYNGKKTEILSLAATQMDLEIIVLSEVSLTTTNTYDIIYMWNLKQNNKLIENRKTD